MPKLRPKPDQPRSMLGLSRGRPLWDGLESLDNLENN